MLVLWGGGECMETVYYFLVGMFAFNSLPHLISGIMGKTHMTPISRDSSAIVNVVWGYVNIAGALVLLKLTPNGIQPPPEFGVITILFGGFVMSLSAAWLFSNPNARMPWWPK
jgi:hypothetical protein